VKALNPYTAKFPDFERTPKAVVAAICYSLAERLSAFDDSDDASGLIRAEWAALYANGIVPQKPIAKAEGGAA